MFGILLMAAVTIAPATSPACFGSRSCGCQGYSSSCYGGGYGGCYGGCYGGGYGGCYGGGGCHGYGRSYGGCYGSGYGGCYGGGVIVVPSGSGTYEQAPKPKKDGASLNTARMVVQVPADAKVFVDGQATKLSNETKRTFVSPPLDPGVDYAYEVKIEVVRDGQTLSETRKVIVRAGQESSAAFADSKAPADKAVAGK